MDRINQLNLWLFSRNDNNPQMIHFKLRNILIINFLFLIIISFSLYSFLSKRNNLSLSKKPTPIKDLEYILDNNYIYDNIDSIINYSQIDDILLNSKKHKRNNNTYFKSFSEPEFYKITKERILYEKQKQSILKALFNNRFEGKWEMNENNKNKNLSFLLGNARKGSTTFEFEKAYEVRRGRDAIALVMKNNEGDYIDHWIKHTSYSVYEKLNKKVNNLKNTFEINGKFTTKYEKGEIFDTTYKGNNRCNTSINMIFPLIYEDANSSLVIGKKEVSIGKIASINVEKFNIFIDSSCGFQIYVDAKIINKEKDIKTKKNELKIYFLISLFSALLYVFGVMTLIFGIRKTEMAISAFNIESIVLNSVWNFYGFASFSYLAFKYYDYFLSFFFIGIISLIKFIIFDTLIFFIFWRIKDMTTTNDCILAKLKIRFYVLLFILIILSFFIMTTLYINYFWIAFIFLVLWIPQIIHNIITNNRYGLPFIYIFACTFDRIINPFYFRCFKNNFFMINTNSNFFISIIIVEFFPILILLMQTFKGPRFMLAQKYKEFPYAFYKSKEELQNNNKDINNKECIICLMPIFSEEKKIAKIEMKEKISNIVEEGEKIDGKNNKSEDSTQSQNSTELEKDNISDINIILQESKVDGSLLKNEEKSNINVNTNTNSLIKKEDVNKKINTKNEDDKKKEEEEVFNVKQNENILKKGEEEVFNVKQKENILKKEYWFKKVICFTSFINKVVEILKIFIKKNILNFYKSSSNIENKLYMLTPCKHIFHSECLENWLEQKKECPNCKTSFENLI